MACKGVVGWWISGTAEATARFFAATFPDSAVGALHRAPGDDHAGKGGDVLRSNSP